MSFSSDLKEELAENTSRALHCRLACTAGMMTGRGRVSDDGSLSFRSENSHVVECFEKHIRLLFDERLSGKLLHETDERGRFVVRIRDEELAGQLLLRCKLRREDKYFCPDGILTERLCCKKAFICGVYMAAGAAGSPEKAYQLEIRLRTDRQTDFTAGILRDLGINPKQLSRCSDSVIYMKEGNAISDFFAMLGASRAMMEFENIRIMKDIRNDINREVNCDTANSKKTAVASKRQREDILLVMHSPAWEGLPEHLKAAAEARLNMPDLSLAELGETLDPPVGKSGIRHRLNKINEIADTIRKKESKS